MTNERADATADGTMTDVTATSAYGAIEHTPSLVGNALSNWAALAINLAVGFVLTPIIIAFVQTDGYGIWTLVGAIIGYYGLLDLGITSALGRYVAYHAGRDDHDALNRTVSSAFVVFLMTGLAVFLASVVLARPLAHFFTIDPHRADSFRWLIYILGLNLTIEFPGKIFRATLRAHEYFIPTNVVMIITTLMRATLVIYLLQTGWALIGLGLAYLVTNAFAIIATAIICRRRLPHLTIRRRLASWSVVKTLALFGGTTMIITVADTFRFNIDSVVIGRYLDLSMVGIYAIAANLIRYFIQGVTTGTAVVTPRLSKLEGAADRDALRRLVLSAMWVSAGLACSGALLLIVGGKVVIRWWVGPAFDPAVPPLIILAMATAISMSQSPSIGALYALNRHRVYAVLMVTEAALNVIASIILVHYYGIVGVALGTAIPLLLISGIAQPIYLCRCLGVPLRSYWLRLLPALGVQVIAIPMLVQHLRFMAAG